VTETTPTRAPSLFSTGAPEIACEVNRDASSLTGISSRTLITSGFMMSLANRFLVMSRLLYSYEL
jgi:hypothetical protein